MTAISNQGASIGTSMHRQCTDNAPTKHGDFKHDSKKEPVNEFLFTVAPTLSLFYVENLFAVVVTANLAYAMRLKHLTACRI